MPEPKSDPIETSPEAEPYFPRIHPTKPRTLIVWHPLRTDQYPISSPFGERNDPETGKPTMHNGIDFATPVGVKVYPMAPGRIFMTGWEADPNKVGNYKNIGFGLRLWMTANIGGIQFGLWHGHLSALHVGIAQKIHGGENMGLTGDTGRTFGAHLHVQARQMGTRNYYDLEFIDGPLDA